MTACPRCGWLWCICWRYALLLTLVSCSAPRGLAIKGASPGQMAELQSAIDLLRSQTSGFIDSPIVQDNQATTVSLVDEESPEGKDICASTSQPHGLGITVWRCGWQGVSDKAFGGFLMHELVHAHGVKGHVLTDTGRALMGPIIDPNREQTFCLHELDFAIIHAATGTDTSSWWSCPDY